MKRIATLFETILSAALLISGLYLLHQANPTNDTVIVIAGAVCLALGAVALVSAAKSILWHRRMLRHSQPNH